MSRIACSSCGKRKKLADGSLAPIVPVGPQSKVVFYAFGPDGEEIAGGTLYQARILARGHGAGWSVGGRRELVD